jgi:MFS family permease
MKGFKKDGDPKYEFMVDLNLTASQYGILSGPAFTAIYSILGLFMGVLTDRMNRKMLLAISAICWSACTAVSGLT